MGKLFVGLPLYHWTPAAFFTNWLRLDMSQVAATTTINGAYITTSCEQIVDNAFSLDVQWDRLVILEHDILAPPHALTRMSHYTPEQAIVGSMYFRHEPPHTAVVYADCDSELLPITPGTVKAWTDEPGLYRVGAVGFGLISIARHVLETWDPSVPMFSIDSELGSHDLRFCREAARRHHIYVDSAIVCDHLTTVSVGLSHNQACEQMVIDAQTFDFDYANT